MSAIDQIMYDWMYRISKPHWDDSRVPPQVVQLAAQVGPAKTALELGCGTGTHSIYLAQQGFSVTGLDFSPTALRKARQKAALAAVKPEFIVHDVTNLDILGGPFDIALDVGCFHGLSAALQQRYVLELSRLMAPASTFLLWAMDNPPRGRAFLSPAILEQTFSPAFKLDRLEPSQLHGRQSKWYWLVRQ